MLIEESPNLLAVILKLIFQSVEELDQCERQSALGSSDGRRTAKLVGLGKDFQSLLVELWTIEMMHVQELLPFPAASLAEQLRSGKLLHEVPTRSRRPILKGLQRRRIILVESRLELIDHLGAFDDEVHFVPAEQPQLLDERIQGLQSSPAMTVDP